MTTLKTKLALVAASTLAFAAISRADTPAPAVSIGGYGAASWQHTNGAPDDHLGIDSALLSATGTYGAVTGMLSLYYVPGTAIISNNGNTDSDLHVLDINATWTMGSGWSVEGGRFLSWMGYESFFTINNPEISGANNVAGFIPGYEDGARIVYTQSDWNAGIAIVDSAYNSFGTSPVTGLPEANGFAGDGELKANYGSEAYLNYTGVKDLNVWFGVSHDSADRLTGTAKGITTFDAYAQYQLTKELYAAAEYTVEDNVSFVDTETWIALADYTFSDTWSAAFRVSGDTYNGPDIDDLKYTFAPTYTVNPHFSVRGEISYLVHNGATQSNADSTFLGAQMIFKF
jgi:hypothetical protein